MNILGTEKTVKSFRHADFKTFVKNHIDTGRIVFSITGNIKEEEVIRLAEKHMGHIPRISSKQYRKKFTGYRPKEVVLKRPIKQSRCAIGRTSYSLQDAKRSSFYLLNNLLGGSGMNSRLNLSLREKHGLVYSIGSSFTPFTDTGCL